MGPAVTRLLWLFLIGNIALAIGDAITDRIFWGSISGIAAAIIAFVLAEQADTKRKEHGR